MATIKCFPQTHFNGDGKTYYTNQPDLTKDFPNGIYSAKVTVNSVTVFEETKYETQPGNRLPIGDYPDRKEFPLGFKSLTVQ